jgi:uncharacterized repeat protein (TIGR01451 family)
MNAQFLGNDYEIAQSSSTVALSPSPVTLAIRINNQENYVARAGDSLTLTVHYENKSGVALSNVVLNTTLAGEMIDFTSLVSNARIEPMSHTLTWDSSNMPVFALLDAGASGDVSATLRLKNLFPLKRIGDKNYVVKATATLTSPTVPYYITAAQTMSAAKSETKISGLIALESKLFFRDTNADVINFGPFPPRVGQPTEYSIHWIVRNYSTDVKDVIVRGALKPGVSFVIVEKSSMSTSPQIDNVTGELIWNISKIPATRGAIGAPIEAIIKVKATPTAGDAGQFMNILGESVMRATDEFTGLELSARAGGLSTMLTDDATVGQEGGRVLPQ